MPPLAFDKNNQSRLSSAMQFFIGDANLTKAIVSCLSQDPNSRPDARDVELQLRAFKGKLKGDEKPIKHPDYYRPVDKEALGLLIEKAINGLITESMVMDKGIWCARITPMLVASKNSTGFEKIPGLYNGIAGPMLTIAEAKLSGFDISHCVNTYQRNWEFLQSRSLSDMSSLTPTLSSGSAGIAIAISRGMDAGLIKPTPEEMSRLKQCFELPLKAPDLRDGLAGQGLAALKCAHWLGADFQDQLVRDYITPILQQQKSNGNWLMLESDQGKSETAILYDQGNTGICSFLLDYIENTHDHEVWKNIERSLQSFKSIHGVIKSRYQHAGYRGHLQNVQLCDGFAGLIRVYLKAYRISKDESWKALAEDLLSCYPETPVHEDLSMQTGLAGLANLYTEAALITQNPRWEDRASWIISLLLHIGQENKAGDIFWLSNNQTLATAGYMNGNSGIILSLLRYYETLQNQTLNI